MAAIPGQRVLVLSALSDVESKVRSLELGASDYMTKPFALAELIARVRARLRESAAPPVERFVQVGHVTLDQERHTAELDGRKVSLSCREVDLLAYLMRRAGTVCSRDQLLAGVWEYQFDPRTNVVDVYVRRLRQKLGCDVIETVRNVGYAFWEA
jgi:DNA-binding response OmpR family regulator